MLLDCVLEPRHAVEREEPDPQREHVVLVERRLEERAVGAAVDVAVDALVELDQRPLVVVATGLLQLVEERGRLRRGRRRSRARPRAGPRSSRAARRTSESPARSRTFDARDEHAASGVDVDELLARQGTQGLPHGRAPQLEPCHQRALVTTEPGGSSSETISSRMRKYAWSESDRAPAASG